MWWGGRPLRSVGVETTMMVSSPSLLGSDSIDVSTPALRGCRRLFIFLLFVTGMARQPGATLISTIVQSSQKGRHVSDINTHFIKVF